jgi:hypothetical protein
MTTPSRNASVLQIEKSRKAPLTLARVVAAIFMVELRDSLEAQRTVDKSDIVFHYGLL